jgi:hypothetical protein
VALFLSPQFARPLDLNCCHGFCVSVTGLNITVFFFYMCHFDSHAFISVDDRFDLNMAIMEAETAL